MFRRMVELNKNENPNNKNENDRYVAPYKLILYKNELGLI